MRENRRITRLLTSLALGMVAIGSILLLRPETADAGIYDTHNETVYGEHWVVHANNYSGECDNTGHTTAFTWTFIEPLLNDCEKTLNFDMPTLSTDNSVEIYADLWRNRDVPSAAFSINGNTDHQTNVGSDWSRTPYVASIPVSEFQSGSNQITFKDSGSGQYHVHDVAFRIYGPGVGNSNAPTGSLTGITADNGFFDPMSPVSNNLLVDTDQLVLSATVTSENADYIEFHAFYDGYDEDNDGVNKDWHNRGNTLLHPGGTQESPLGGTIDHIATIPVNGSGVYTATWDMPYIVAQQGVRFKVRLVNNEGTINYVRDAAGGESAAFTLLRSMPVVYFIDPDFEDIVLHNDGNSPDTASVSIELPADISDFDTAYLIGSYWRNPYIRINGLNPRLRAFPASSADGEWYLSILEIDIGTLHGGINTVDYSHRNSYGEFIEEPGPMIVLKRTTPVGGSDTTAPYIYNEQPEHGSLLVDVNTTVTAAVFDAGSIDLNNDLSMSIKIGGGAYQPVTPTIVGNDFNAYLSYTHPGGFPFDTLIAVQISATDRSGNLTVSDFSFTTAPELGNSNLVSDDFNACSLNAGLWTFVDPKGDDSVSINGEQVLIDTAAGSTHNLYGDIVNGNIKDAPRIMQASNNQNFDIEVKYDSIPSEVIEGQGIIIEEDDNDYLRFNYHYDNTGKVRIFGYKTVNGITSEIANGVGITPVPGSSLYLRIVRSNFQDWIFAYSTDGIGWHVPNGLEFTDTMTVSQVGIFSINWGNPETSAPGYVTSIDYFLNHADPFVGGEDSEGTVLQVASGGDGLGTVTKDFECGNPVTVQAGADPGSYFDHWSGVAAINGTNTTPVSVAFNKGDVLVGHFTRYEYALTIDVVSVDHEGTSSSSTAGGSVTLSQNSPYYYNDNVMLTAVPTPGWTFTGWQGAGLTGNNLSETITIQQTESVTATFTQEKYSITVTPPPENGEIIVGTPVDGRSYFIYGDEVTIEARPTDPDWKFIGWGGDLSGTENPKTITVTGDLNITATFNDQYYIYLPLIMGP